MSDEDPTDGADDTDGMDVSRRTFLRGGTTTVAGIAGAEAVSGGERGGQGSGEKTVLVIGRDAGFHEYEIELEAGGSIYRGTHAGGNDWVGGADRRRVGGEVQHWNVDSYRYSGTIERVAAEASVSFHFVDGAFRSDERIVAGGMGSGKHDYVVGTNSGDIDPVSETTGGADTDRGGSRSEKGFSPDHVTGRLNDDGVDTHDIGGGQPVQYVHVRNGYAAISSYDPDAATTPTSGAKEASIVYFYMGDGAFTTFFQNFVNLRLAQKGYDRTVLLKYANVSVASQALADRLERPTPENFATVVESLVEKGYTIDLFIVSHGLRGTFKMSTGSFGSEYWFDRADIDRLRARFGGNVPLRLVYQGHCWAGQMNDAWRRLGAKAAVGARYVNFFPNQFVDFLKQWRRGHSVRDAVNRANTVSSRWIVRQYLRNDIKLTRGDRWAAENDVNAACPNWVVLNTGGGCAKDYFTNRWLHNDSEWHSIVPKNTSPFFGADGWDFVRRASAKSIAGDTSVSRDFQY